MQQHNQDAKDGVVFDTAAIKIGGVGMDMRQPANPNTLADLINARFTTRYTRRRDGHTGYPTVDGGAYPANPSLSPSGWLYGHGQTVTELMNTSMENDHYPVAGQARGTFNFGASRVVWTGDRLLTLRNGNTALGQHKFWNRDGGLALSYGVPAYLPTMTEDTAPKPVGASYLNTCLTERYRVNVWYTPGLQAQVIDRETGALIFEGDISGASSNDPVDPVVFASGDKVVVIWRDFANDELYITYWTGLAWSEPSLVQSDVSAYAVALVPGGFHLVWALESTGAIKIGRYSGVSTQDSPYTFNTQLVAGPSGCDGDIALAVNPAGGIGVLWVNGTDLCFQEFSSSASAVDSPYVIASGTWTVGLAVNSRELRRNATRHDWVIHAGKNTEQVIIKSIYYNDNVAGYVEASSCSRYNSTLASKSFRVGDEVFCWLRSTNSLTNYLLAGTFNPQVVAVADREEAIEATEHSGVYGVPHVFPDFADDTGYRFSWARSFNTGRNYARGGNARFGNLDFLPQLSTAHYGKSVYLSGSCVKNWDGQELLEAGFHDYPTSTGSVNVESVAGSLSAGFYRIRVYAVRYNQLGERFQSAARTSPAVEVTNTHVSNGTRTITWAIKTVPVTSTENVVLEVWATEVGGTTYYYHGSVANNLNASTVNYTISAPISISIAEADPHEPGVGQLKEIEEWGPIGCSILTVVGDRMWSAGGQVPAGAVQFSKLKEPNEGVGHDDLAQLYEVDTTGQPITSISAFNETIAAFQTDRISLIPPPGPDNYGRGGYPAPQVVLADGASVHTGTATVPDGIVYWSSHGPMLLTRDLQVANISAAVQPLAKTMTPTGVRVDYDNSEVIWFTEEGTALLLNYLDAPRWARWTGLPAVGVTEDSIISPEGVLMVEDPDANGDAGRPYKCGGTTGWVRPEELLQGHSRLRSFGFTGEYLGAHTLRFRIRYDGNRHWSEQQEWEPATDNWLSTVEDVENLMPAQVDALTTRSRSGRYGFSKRVKRQDCERFSIEWSDIASDTPTYVPHEISVELGALPGHGRGVINTFR